MREATQRDCLDRTQTPRSHHHHERIDAIRHGADRRGHIIFHRNRASLRVEARLASQLGATLRDLLGGALTCRVELSHLLVERPRHPCRRIAVGGSGFERPPDVQHEHGLRGKETPRLSDGRLSPWRVVEADQGWALGVGHMVRLRLLRLAIR